MPRVISWTPPINKREDMVDAQPISPYPKKNRAYKTTMINKNAINAKKNPNILASLKGK